MDTHCHMNRWNLFEDFREILVKYQALVSRKYGDVRYVDMFSQFSQLIS